MAADEHEFCCRLGKPCNGYYSITYGDIDRNEIIKKLDGILLLLKGIKK